MNVDQPVLTPLLLTMVDTASNGIILIMVVREDCPTIPYFYVPITVL